MKIKLGLFASFAISILAFTLIGLGGKASAANYGSVNIIDDSVMNNLNTMTAAQINGFLNGFAGTCLGTNSGFTNPDPQGYSGGGYQFGGNVDAGSAIRDISVHYNINPQVVIATLEKEQGLIDRNGNCSYNNPAPAPAGASCNNTNGTGPTYCSYACQNTPQGGCVAVAVGYGCPGYCRNDFLGFSKQISASSWLFRFAEARAEGQMTGYSGHDTGDENICYTGPMTAGYRQRSLSTSTCARAPGNQTIFYDGSYTDVDGNTMYISNGATASMLNYTPFYARSYLPNDLFISKFTQWFSSPNYVPPTCDSRLNNISCVWQLHNPSADSDFLTISSTERDSAVYNNHYIYDTVPFYAFTSQQPGTIPVYRILTPTEHFYTTSTAEKNSLLLSSQNTYEGVAYYVYPTVTTTNASYPIYRLNGSNGHVFTANASVKDMLVSDGYTYEDVAFNAPSAFANAPDPSLNYINIYRISNNNKHLYTTDLNERDSLLRSGWNYEGIIFDSPSSVTNSPVYRLASSNGDHIFTTSLNEKNHLTSTGWSYEGVAWYLDNTSPQAFRFYVNGYHFFTTDLIEALSITNTPGVQYEGIGFGYNQYTNLPVYRLRNNIDGSNHIYTSDVNEAISLNNAGWKYEGVGWYGSSTSITNPIFRLYNGNEHFFTSNTIERDQLINAGWKYEGVGWYGM